jgi:hypothetical protein
VCLTAIILCGNLSAFAAGELIPRSHQYPNGKTIHFTSWSLFLICDPVWLRSESEADLFAVYNAYLSLVTAADPSHAALGVQQRDALAGNRDRPGTDQTLL